MTINISYTGFTETQLLKYKNHLSQKKKHYEKSLNIWQQASESIGEWKPSSLQSANGQTNIDKQTENITSSVNVKSHTHGRNSHRMKVKPSYLNTSISTIQKPLLPRFKAYLNDK